MSKIKKFLEKGGFFSIFEFVRGRENGKRELFFGKTLVKGTL